MVNASSGKETLGEFLSFGESKAERPYFRTWLCLVNGGTFTPDSSPAAGKFKKVKSISLPKVLI